MNSNPGPDVDSRSYTYGDEELHAADGLDYSEDAAEYVPEDERLRRLRDGIAKL